MLLNDKVLFFSLFQHTWTSNYLFHGGEFFHFLNHVKNTNTVITFWNRICTFYVILSESLMEMKKFATKITNSKFKCCVEKCAKMFSIIVPITIEFAITLKKNQKLFLFNSLWLSLHTTLAAISADHSR
jgi:hypothetical protein